MAQATPSGFIDGLKAKTKTTDQLETDLNGATIDGILARSANGEYATVGDCRLIQVPFSAFAVAGTDASVLIGTMPANSLPIEGSIYVEIAGDGVSTLTLDIRFGSVDLGLGCDGLTALTPEYWTILNQNDGIVPRQPAALAVYARAVSTGANLNTMTTGLFNFVYSYNTPRVVV
jgi:hypothetical protein